MRGSYYGLVVLLVPLLLVQVLAVNTISATSDSTILLDTDPSDGTDYGTQNYGAYWTLKVGKYWHSGKVIYVARTVLDFDLSSISCAVSKAELVLTAMSGGDIMLRVFPLDKGFVESEVTGKRAKSGDPWNGGEYDKANQLDHKYFSRLSSGQEVRLDVTEWVRSYRRGNPVYGLIIDSGGSDGNASFYSRETGYGPRIEYECILFRPPTSIPLTPTTTSSTTSTSTTTSPTVTPSPVSLFYLGIDPPYLQLERGSWGEVEVKVSSLLPGIGVSLSVKGLPPGVSASYTKSSGTTPFNSTLRIMVSSGAPLGSHNLEIEATSGSRTWKKTLTLEIVEKPKPFFFVRISPPAIISSPGDEVSYTIEVIPVNGFSNQVTLSFKAPPAFSPTLDVSSGTPPFKASLRLIVPSNAREGVIRIGVSGESGPLKVRDDSVLIIKSAGHATTTRTSRSIPSTSTGMPTSTPTYTTKTSTYTTTPGPKTQMKSPPAPQPTEEVITTTYTEVLEVEKEIPWTLVAVAAILLVLGVFLFLRRPSS